MGTNTLVYILNALHALAMPAPAVEVRDVQVVVDSSYCRGFVGVWSNAQDESVIVCDNGALLVVNSAK